MVFVLLIEDVAIDKNKIRVIVSIHRSIDIKCVRFVEIPIRLSKKALVVVKYTCSIKRFRVYLKLLVRR